MFAWASDVWCYGFMQPVLSPFSGNILHFYCICVNQVQRWKSTISENQLRGMSKVWQICNTLVPALYLHALLLILYSASVTNLAWYSFKTLLTPNHSVQWNGPRFVCNGKNKKITLCVLAWHLNGESVCPCPRSPLSAGERLDWSGSCRRKLP